MTEQTKRRPKSKRRFAREPQTTNQTASSEAEKMLPVKKTTKIVGLIAMLRRSKGATLAEIVDATGWQSHSARAGLTGLKKKGHVIEKSKRNDVTIYHITQAG